MSKVTPDFLRAVQMGGWQIVTADSETVWAGCPRAGCGLTVKIKPGAAIPTSCRAVPDLSEVVIDGFEDARRAMRARREQLGLSIRNVEEAAGLADDYLAKFEKDDPSKIPNAQSFMEWIQALGYEVVLRPRALPPYTMRIISETRDQLRARRKVFNHFGKLRKERGAG